MITNNNTIEYKDKLQAQYNAKITELLKMLPPFCEAYERFQRSHNKTKTRVEYLTDIYNFFRYLVNANPKIDSIRDITTEYLEQLTGFDFDDYLDWLSNYKFDSNDEKEKFKTNTNASKKRKMMAIRSLFHFLYIRDVISCNPTEKAVIPSVKKKKRKEIAILEDNECSLFLDTIDKAYVEALDNIDAQDKPGKKDSVKPYLIMRDKAIVYLILGTGLRVSELCAINCSDISYSLGYINVIRKGDEDTDKTSDQVYLSDEVMNVLIDYVSDARSHLEPDTDNYDALFISSKHQRMTPRAIELMVKKYANEALGTNNNVHPHTLRATFGTRYYRMTGDISATSTAMNHSGVEITAQFYVRENENAKRNAANLRVKRDE